MATCCLCCSESASFWFQQTEDEKDLEYAFFGIFDGHGGVEAAGYAKEHLMETIIKHKNFWSDDDEEVLRAIKDGFIATHYAMWREQRKLKIFSLCSSSFKVSVGICSQVAQNRLRTTEHSWHHRLCCFYTKRQDLHGACWRLRSGFG